MWQHSLNDYYTDSLHEKQSETDNGCFCCKWQLRGRSWSFIVDVSCFVVTLTAFAQYDGSSIFIYLIIFSHLKLR